MNVKTREIRDLNAEERATKLKEARTELMHERGVAAMGGAVRNPGKMRALRTDIARLLTVMKEPAAAAPAAKAKKPAKTSKKKEAGR